MPLGTSFTSQTYRSVSSFSTQPQAFRPRIVFSRAKSSKSAPRSHTGPSGPRGNVRRTPPPTSRKLWKRSPASTKPKKEPVSPTHAVSLALRNHDNNLRSPVQVPEDPHGVLTSDHPATSILSNSAIVVTRQMELMNVMIGFEQANKYTIMDPDGNHIGYMAEKELGMGNMMARQMFSTHRSFTTHVFDKHGKEVLRFHRPFSYISSRIGVYDPLDVSQGSRSASLAVTTSASGSLSTEVNTEAAQVSPLALSDMRIIGEAQQQWALLRRKYNLFLYRSSQPLETGLESQMDPPPNHPLSNSQAMDLTPYNEEGKYNQFASVDEPFLSWDFSLLSLDSKLIGSVNRNFAGFGREIFTDTGIYALRMDAAGLSQEPKHLISQSGQQDLITDTTPNPGMTLDQRAVMLATAVSVDFDYFSRHSGSGGGMGGFFPVWFPGAGGGGAAAGEAGAEAEAGSADSASPTAGQSGSGSGYGSGDQQLPGQVGQDEDVWGNTDDPWGNNAGHGGGDGGDGGDFGGGGDFFDF